MDDTTTRFLAALIAYGAATNVPANEPAAPMVAQRLCPAANVTTSDVERSPLGRCLEKWERLATADGHDLWRARYRVESGKEGASVLVTEVLFESKAGAHSFRAVWLTQASPDEYQIEQVVAHEFGKWNLVEVFGCLEGTGGCGQDLVLWRPGTETGSVEGVRAAFDEALPKGFTTLKAPLVRVAERIVTGNGWRTGDANSSPSLEMTCALAFDGVKFSLGDCEHRATGAPARPPAPH